MRHEALRCAMHHEVYRDGQCIMKYRDVLEAQVLIQRNRFRQAGNRFLGSLKGLQIRALGLISASSDTVESEGAANEVMLIMYIKYPKNISLFFLHINL